MSKIRYAIIFLFAVVSGLAITGCSSSNGSNGTTVSGSMSGSEVVPPVTTASAGEFDVTLDSDGISLTIDIRHNFAALTAATLNGPALAGVNGPVIADLLAVPVRDNRGPIQLNEFLSEKVELTPEQVENLEEGQLYLRLANNSDEVRGQIPEFNINPMMPTGMLEVRGLSYHYVENTPATPENPLRVGNVKITNGFNTDISWRIGLDLSLNAKYELTGNNVETQQNGDGTAEVTTVDPMAQFAQILMGADIIVPSMSGIVIDPIEIDVFESDLFEKGSIIGNAVISLTSYFRPDSVRDDYRRIAWEIGGTPLEDAMDGFLRGYSRTMRYPSPAGLPALLAQDENQLMSGTYAVGVTGYNDRALAPFPCGSFTLDTTDGLVICPTFPTAQPSPGPFLYYAMVMDGDIPLAHATNYYQYGIVFDEDGIESNNFEASQAFPNDFFQGTDLWYFVNYDPTNGWSLSTVNAQGAGNPQSFFSDASCIIFGNTIFWVIPFDEIGDNFPAIPAFRATSFRNNGPFNVLDDYHTDYEPGLDEPLMTIAFTTR